MGSIIEIRNILFSYPHARRTILNDCSLTVNSGDLVTILGPNGAGKSTLLNCGCGLLRPLAGEIFMNGQRIQHMAQRDIAKVIGYVQQSHHFAFPHTVMDYVLMGRASHIGLFQKPSEEDRAIALQAIKRMGILSLCDAPITEISGGECQQAAIARAVAQQPQVIFFDEPTAHLDYGNQIQTLRLINSLRREGFAVVMTTHNPDHCMMLGGRVAILDREGHLEVGTVESILSEERLSRIYNAKIHLIYNSVVDRVVCVPGELG